MCNIARAACRDYNNNIETIKSASYNNGIDTMVSVVKCGIGPQAKVIRETVNADVHGLRPLPELHYETTGWGTPLFDSIGELISTFEATPDANDPNISFLVMVITDGKENRSHRWTGRALMQKIKDLQDTDRWTFVFRVPRGYASELTTRGIHAGNILEWDQTDHGVEVASAATADAFQRFYVARSKGEKSTTRFYADLSDLKASDVKTHLDDISGKIMQLYVPADENRVEIKDFVIKRNGSYVQGSAFYQLTKTEKVQESKQIIIQDQTTSKFYTGRIARQMLGFPEYGQITVSPRSLGNFKVFIQSMSVNRHLMGDTNLIIYYGR
jgi:hypothetical protein